MSLIFKIDFQYDLEMLWEFFYRNKEISEISKMIGLDQSELEEIVKQEGLNKAEDIIKAGAKRKHAKLRPFMENSVNYYQESWNKIWQEFFALVEEKTQHLLQHDTYYCVVSAFHQGISNWGGNTIVRKWSIHPDVQRPVTAHEVVLSHFWTILDKHPVAKSWQNEDKWKYCEIFSWCLLGLEKEFQQFWPWLLEQDRWPLNHNYPEIIPLQKKIGSMHGKYDNFKDFFEGVLKK